MSDSKRVLKLRLSGACTVNHAHTVGVVRQPRFATRQPPPSCPSTVANTCKPTVVSPSASPEASNVLGLPPRVDAPRALARQPCGGLLVASRFVCAISVSCGNRHTITTWMPSAARLAFVKAPQGRNTVALAPLSSEQGVVRPTAWHRVFGTQESFLRRACLYFRCQIIAVLVVWCLR